MAFEELKNNKFKVFIIPNKEGLEVSFEGYKKILVDKSNYWQDNDTYFIFNNKKIGKHFLKEICGIIKNDMLIDQFKAENIISGRKVLS